MSTEQHHEPQVWAACLSAYNSGVLHGKWLDAAVEPDELWAGVKEVIDTSPVPDAEEHFWADYEGFEGIRIGEYEAVERLVAIARFINVFGEPAALFLGYYGTDDLEQLEDRFIESYAGDFDDIDDLGDRLYVDHGYEQMMQDIERDVPESIEQYVIFDIDAWLNDLQQSGALYVVNGRDGRLHAFWIM